MVCQQDACGQSDQEYAMAERLRVVEIIESTTGGARRHVYDLATKLDKHRFDVSVICATRRDATFADDIQRMRETGLSVVVIDMVRHISPIADCLSFIRILTYLKHHDFDIAHTHSSKAGFLGRIAARLAGVPRILHTAHVFPFQIPASTLCVSIYRMLERFAGRFCDILICVSRSELVAAKEANISDSDKLVLVENGISLQPDTRADGSALRTTLKIPHNHLVIGTVGRLCQQKGQEHFIHSASHIAKLHKDITFVIVGDGEDRERLQALTRESSLTDRCLFLGTRSDMPSVYDMMDIFVLPSLWEALPYSLLEAMSSGTPIVATTVGDVADVVQDEAAILVSPGDESDLTNAISKLVTNPELRRRMGHAATEVVRARYQIAAMLEKTEALYTSGHSS